MIAVASAIFHAAAPTPAVRVAFPVIGSLITPLDPVASHGRTLVGHAVHQVHSESSTAANKVDSRSAAASPAPSPMGTIQSHKVNSRLKPAHAQAARMSPWIHPRIGSTEGAPCRKAATTLASKPGGTEAEGGQARAARINRCLSASTCRSMCWLTFL